MPEGWDGSQRLIAGRFLLLRELGRGGMGTVWLCADETLGRMVAVKELRPPGGLAGTRTHQLRALREARSAAGIKHHGAVTLHEVLSVPGDDAVYLIMEYVEGPTLGELVERHGPLPAPVVASYGLQLLDVLAAAHALGIVHRDVKPDNILIAAGAQVKLADFGIAHNVGDPRLTAAGVMGTRAYTAPELFDENPITPAADLWSLGATLYYAAEGHGAFDREGSDPMLRAILADDIPVPHCEPHLAAAITGLLRRDPRDRATTGQTRLRLRQVPGQPPDPVLPSPPEPPPPGPTSPDPVPGPVPLADPKWNPGADTDVNPHRRTTPPSAPPSVRPRKEKRPGRRPVAIVAALVVLAAVGAAAGLLVAHLHPGTPSAAGSFPGTAPASGTVTKASALRPTPTHAAGTGASSGAASTGNAPPPVRSTSNLDLSLSKTIQGPAGISGIAYSPDGLLLAMYGANNPGDAIVWNPATGTKTYLPFGERSPDVAFSGDDQTVAVAEYHGGVGFWGIATQREISSTDHDHFATGISFDPQNANMLAVGDADGVQLLTVSTLTWGAPLPETAGATGPWTVQFSPTGNTLAAVDRDTGYVYVWSISAGGTGTLIGTIPPSPPGHHPYGLATSLSYSSNGGFLGIGYPGTNGTYDGVRFWDVSTRQLMNDMPTPGVMAVNALASEPKSVENYAVVGTKGNVILWELPVGRNLGDVYDPGDAPLVAVTFNPNATTIATLDANGSISIWNVSS